MRAIAVESLGAEPRLMDLPKPVPAEGEVLVRMGAAGMNPLDWKVAKGLFRLPRRYLFPLVLGSDGAGRIETVGPGVRGFKPGDRIFGQFLHDPVGTGTYAEFAVVPEGIGVVRIPEGISDRDAAALPTAGMTALVALDRLNPAAGSTLLVVGASGGIGSFVLPMARARALRVIAVARRGSEARLRALGAADVIGSEAPNWDAEVRRLAPAGVDAALDLMSDAAGFHRTLSLVRPGGAAGSTVGAAGSAEKPASGAEAVNINLQPSAPLLSRLAEEVLTRRLTVPVERSIRLEEAVAALAEIEAGRARGKVVIVFG